MSNDDDNPLRAAAIAHDGTHNVDQLLLRMAHQQREAGRRVRGLTMSYPDGRDSCHGAMVLVDLDTGTEYSVSQPLGRESTGCRADPQGFARASEVLRRALSEGADLVIVNRFGKLEAEGGGFRAELLDIISSDLPLLTAVSANHLAAWNDFTGGATVLPPDEDAVLAWLDACLQTPTLAAS
jgi:nucleoside-triphosphatase THEP1